MISVLFVCHANICRSPLAEGLFLSKIQQNHLQASFTVDSAGVSTLHIDKLPHPKTLKYISLLNVNYAHRARTVNLDDYFRFDYIFAMDQSNLNAVQRARPVDATAAIHLLMEVIPDAPQEVEDPCYTGNFDAVYQLLDNVTTLLLDKLRTKSAF